MKDYIVFLLCTTAVSELRHLKKKLDLKMTYCGVSFNVLTLLSALFATLHNAAEAFDVAD